MLHMAIMNYKNEYGSFPPCTGDLVTASRHVRKLFPRLAPAQASQQASYLQYLNTTPFSITAGVTPDTAIVVWLFGYNTDPLNPILSPLTGISVSGGILTATSTPPLLTRNKMYDFDRSRINISYQYCPKDSSGSPYILIMSNAYGAPASPTTHLGNYAAETSTTPTGTIFFNPDSFQILCAGRDGIWGPDSDDDLSNFWPGTRRDYLDSLRR